MSHAQLRLSRGGLIISLIIIGLIALALIAVLFGLPIAAVWWWW